MRFTFFSNAFPYTKFNEINLDWIFAQLKNILDKEDDLIEAADSAEQAASEASSSASASLSYSRSAAAAADRAENAVDDILDDVDTALNNAQQALTVAQGLSGEITEAKNMASNAASLAQSSATLAQSASNTAITAQNAVNDLSGDVDIVEGQVSQLETALAAVDTKADNAIAAAGAAQNTANSKVSAGDFLVNSVGDPEGVSIPALSNRTGSFSLSSSTYRAIGLAGFSSGNSNVLFVRAEIEDGVLSFNVRNTSSTAVSTAIKFDVLWVLI